MSPQSAVIEEYLHWLTHMPWTRRTTDNLDLEHAREVLDRDRGDPGDPDPTVASSRRVRTRFLTGAPLA